MDVGVRDLKHRLSELLERASRGEVIRVTDRGRPKAILGPVPGGDHLAQGIETGRIRPPVKERPALVKRVVAQRRIADALHEDRGS
jgi:prevent-host-death family protein